MTIHKEKIMNTLSRMIYGNVFAMYTEPCVDYTWWVDVLESVAYCSIVGEGCL